MRVLSKTYRIYQYHEKNGISREHECAKNYGGSSEAIFELKLEFQ